jgi:hypothetical protein
MGNVFDSTRDRLGSGAQLRLQFWRRSNFGARNQEVHAYKMHAYEVHTYELHA